MVPELVALVAPEMKRDRAECRARTRKLFGKKPLLASRLVPLKPKAVDRLWATAKCLACGRCPDMPPTPASGDLHR